MVENSRVRLLVIYRHVHLPLSFFLIPLPALLSVWLTVISFPFPSYLTFTIKWFKQISPKIFRYGKCNISQPTTIFQRMDNFGVYLIFCYKFIPLAIFFGQSPRENIWPFKYTVERHLPGLIGRASHPDMQKSGQLDFSLKVGYFG